MKTTYLPSLTPLLVCLALLAASCAEEPRAVVSGLRVVVNSDMAPVREVHTLHVRISDRPTGTIAFESTTTDRTPRHDAGITLVPAFPFSFHVVPSRTGAPVQIEIDARDNQGLLLARTSVRVGFVAHELRLLRLDLKRSCSRPCGKDVCSGDGCPPLEVDAGALPNTADGHELDGLVPLVSNCELECGDDGGNDGGGGDAGDPDSATGPDGGIVSDAEVPAETMTRPSPVTANGAPSTDAAVPTAERMVCSEDQQPFWADVGRHMTRNAAGILCPIVSMGDDWGALLPRPSADDAQAKNRDNAARAIKRALSLETDVIGLLVSYVGGALITHFDAGQLPNAGAWPTLGSIFTLPELAQADQPLQLVLSSFLEDPTSAADALLDLLSANRVIRACRPLYLVSSTDEGQAALTHLRARLLTEDVYRDLRPLVHFGSRLGLFHDELSTRLRALVAAGFDRAEFDIRDPRLLTALTEAQQLGLGSHVFYTQPWQASGLCGLTAGVEWSLQLGRPMGANVLDDMHPIIQASRTFLALDTRMLTPSSLQLQYGAEPAQTGLVAALNQPWSPTLAPAEADLPGTALHFRQTRRQWLALGDIEHPSLLPAPAPPSTPFALTISGQLGVVPLAPNERQVLVSKVQGQSGWAVEYVHESGKPTLLFRTFGRNEGGMVHEARAGFERSSLAPNGTFVLFAQVHPDGVVVQVTSGRDESKVGSFVPGTYAPHRQIDIDATITLGASPGGTDSFFEGKLQLVRMTSFP